VPAAAVIPAPKAYSKVAVVEKLVVGRGERRKCTGRKSRAFFEASNDAGRMLSESSRFRVVVCCPLLSG